MDGSRNVQEVRKCYLLNRKLRIPVIDSPLYYHILALGSRFWRVIRRFYFGSLITTIPFFGASYSIHSSGSIDSLGKLTGLPDTTSDVGWNFISDPDEQRLSGDISFILQVSSNNIDWLPMEIPIGGPDFALPNLDITSGGIIKPCPASQTLSIHDPINPYGDNFGG